MNFIYSTAIIILSVIIVISVTGCSNAEEQLRIACNTGSLSMKSGEYEGSIWNIRVHKDSKGGFSAFQLRCPSGEYFSFDWIGGDLSKAEPLSTAVVTVKNGVVTNVTIRNRWLDPIFSVLKYLVITFIILFIGSMIRNRKISE